jgi:hypothetical protein
MYRPSDNQTKLEPVFPLTLRDELSASIAK